MNPPLAVNSICPYCRKPQLWAYLLSAGCPVPLDRSSTGRVRLVRGDRLECEFLSLDQLAVVHGQQRDALARGDVPEQLYDLHSGDCREKAKQDRARRPRRHRNSKGGHQ